MTIKTTAVAAFAACLFLLAGLGIAGSSVNSAGISFQAQDDAGSGGDAGNTYDYATLISSGTYTGYLDEYSDTADFYKIWVGEWGELSVELTSPSGADFDLYLYSEGFFGPTLVNWSELGEGSADSVFYFSVFEGYFYIEVSDYYGSGVYTLVVQSSSTTTQDDMGSGGDAGDTFWDATSLTLPAQGTGYLDQLDFYDYYEIEATAGSEINITLVSPSGADFDLYLYNSWGLIEAYSELPEGYTDTISYRASSTGSYYIGISSWSGSGTYSLVVTGVSSGSQNDWDSGTDAGDTIGQSLQISAGSGSGYLDEEDTSDFYKTSVMAGNTIDLALEPPSGADFDLYLYGPSGTEVARSINAGSELDTISYPAGMSGDYFIETRRYEGAGIYSLSVSISGAGEVLAESPHPYPNNYDQTWTISSTGAGQIRVHFTQLDVEDGWDHVYIYDENYNLVQGYTGSHPNTWTDWVNGGTMRVRLVSDYSVTGYGFRIDEKETGEEPPPPPPGEGNKFAILVGVNDYQDPFINDLMGCVEDAMDMRSYLIEQGYEISYFLADSQATEANIKAAIAAVIARAGPDSTIVFSFSGHGGKSDEVGLPAGNSVLCCHNSGWGTDGNLMDLELRNAFSGYQGRLFVFLDSCRSGGMNEVINSSNRYMTTTCTDDGYGFGIPWYQNGGWGYWFVDKGLLHGQSGHDDMEGNFTWAKQMYITDILGGTEYDTPSHYPQEFDGDFTELFEL